MSTRDQEGRRGRRVCENARKQRQPEGKHCYYFDTSIIYARAENQPHDVVRQSRFNNNSNIGRMVLKYSLF